MLDWQTRRTYIPLTMQADEIKAIRTRAGMTQAQFAREIGVDVLSVSRWERGVYTPLPIVQAAIKAKFGSKPRKSNKKTEVA